MKDLKFQNEKELTTRDLQMELDWIDDMLIVLEKRRTIITNRLLNLYKEDYK